MRLSYSQRLILDIIKGNNNEMSQPSLYIQYMTFLGKDKTQGSRANFGKILQKLEFQGYIRKIKQKNTEENTILPINIWILENRKVYK